MITFKIVFTMLGMSRSGSLRRGNEPRQVKLVHVKVEVNTSEASSCTNNLLQMYLQQTV